MASLQLDDRESGLHARGAEARASSTDPLRPRCDGATTSTASCAASTLLQRLPDELVDAGEHLHCCILSCAGAGSEERAHCDWRRRRSLASTITTARLPRVGSGPKPGRTRRAPRTPDPRGARNGDLRDARSSNDEPTAPSGTMPVLVGERQGCPAPVIGIEALGVSVVSSLPIAARRMCAATKVSPSTLTLASKRRRELWPTTSCCGEGTRSKMQESRSRARRSGAPSRHGRSRGRNAPRTRGTRRRHPRAPSARVPALTVT